jgi:hypothetical protein
MSKRLLLLVVVVLGVAVSAAGAATRPGADSREFDPGRSFLVQAEWLRGIGCPTNARSANPNADFSDWNRTHTPYTDPACPTGDRKDRRNEGLLLAKTGPLENFASAVVDIRGVKGKALTELGYDIRKPGTTAADPRGSWCGAGAPRFNIQTKDDSYFLGCASPPPTSQLDGHGFVRLTWGSPLMAFGSEGALEPVTGKVKSLRIVFDEGTTAGGAELGFGLAVLDNINVNGVRVGQGPREGDDDDEEEADDDGDSPRHCDDCKRRNGYDD